MNNSFLKRALSISLLSSLSLLMNCTADNVSTVQPSPQQTTQNPNTPVKPANNKMLFAVYMIGSDLEDDVLDEKGVADEVQLGGISSEGAGSSDLREMVKSYTNLSEEQKNNFDVIVGFGGARKQGWKGIKYADMPCLIKDSQDNYFGNDDCYSKNAPDASMGNTDTFKDFLAYIKTKYPDNGKNILTMWDHGGAYLGSGPDTNTDQKLTLPMMNEALAATNKKWDMIGFDECLMASMEVAKSVKSFASYMLASEELEPGHGWNYTEVFDYIGKNPESSITDIGKKMVDSFIESPDHKETNGRTLSLVDLTKTDNVIKELDNMTSAFNSDINSSFLPVLKSNVNSQNYGKHGKDSVEVSIDLVNFANQIKTNKQDLASQADSLINTLKDFVIYSRDDGTKPNSNGISIFSINNLGIWTNKIYNIEVAVSPTWVAFIDNFMSKGINDLQPPKVEDKGNCKNNNESGECLNITDDNGLKKTVSVRSTKVSNNKYMMVGSEALDKTGDDSYFMSEWDGSLLNLCNGSCNDSNSLIVPAQFEEEIKDGNKIYTAEANINGEDSLFYVEMNKNNQVIDHWLVPYINNNGNTELSREQYQLESGDKVKFYYNFIDVEKDTDTWELGKELQINSSPNWNFSDPSTEGFYFADAEDLKGNSQNSNVISEN